MKKILKLFLWLEFIFLSVLSLCSCDNSIQIAKNYNNISQNQKITEKLFELNNYSVSK